MKLEFTVCDVCKDPTRPVNDYTIARGSVEEIISGNAQLITVERCEEHGAEFEALLSGEAPVREPVRRSSRIEAGPTRRRSIEAEAPSRTSIEASAPRRGNRPRVTTMDDIERRKTR